MNDPKEIERKFLVATLPDLSNAVRSTLRQGYITAPDDSLEVRLRQSGQDYTQTVKSGGGMVRTEREIGMSADQFETLWPATEGRRLEKTRWKGRLDGGLWYELDVYECPGSAPMRQTGAFHERRMTSSS